MRLHPLVWVVLAIPANTLAAQGGAVVTSGTTIGTTGPAARGRQASVSFVAYAPRHSDLKLETVNGPVEIRRT